MPGARAGRIALVTGASRGIGKAIALRLAAEGAAVAVCSRPDPGMADLGTLERTRDELVALGGDGLVVTVFDLGGRRLLDGWQPEQFPDRIETMRQHAAGEISSGPIGLDNVVNHERRGVTE